MHAVVTRVKLPEDRSQDEARQQLESELLPQIRQIPGLVGAYFMAPSEGSEGLSVLLVESKDVAEQASARMQPPQGVTLISSEVREVVASI